MDSLLFLSLPVSIFSLLNKIFLVLEKQSGWVYGSIVGISSAVYFFIIGLNILAVAEIGFFIVMIYGFINHKSKQKKFTVITSIILTFISVIAGTLFFTDNLTPLQITSSLSFIWGGYLLSGNQRIFGWFLFIFAHIATAISGAHKNEIIFAVLQVCSGLVCAYGFFMNLKKFNKEIV